MIARLTGGCTRQARSCPPTFLAHWPPSAQGSFARPGCYPESGRPRGYLGGRYPSVIAPTSPCARPKPSARRGFRLVRAVFAGLLSAPAGRWPFPTLSLRPLRRCSDAYPATLLGCLCPLLHRGRRSHPTGNGFDARIYPHTATSVGSRISRLQSFDYLRAPTLARPPGCSDRGAQRRRAARPFTPRRTRSVTRSGYFSSFFVRLSPSPTVADVRIASIERAGFTSDPQQIDQNLRMRPIVPR